MKGIWVLLFCVACSYGSRLGGCKLSAMPPRPDTMCCGVDSSAGNRIVGGKPTPIRKYPWLALLEYKKRASKKRTTLCGGALISGKYVLTAAHCVSSDILKTDIPVVVRLGEYDKKHEGPDCTNSNGYTECTDGAIRIPIEKVTIHPEYEEKIFENDIALIRLKKMAPYTDFIRPLCLPTSDLTRKQPEHLYVAGWGTQKEIIQNDTIIAVGSDLKRHVDVPYFPFERCDEIYENLSKATQLCAGGRLLQDSCSGDSGGPLMYDNGGQYESVGVVSYGGDICGLEGVPGIYTKVHSYLDWIHQHIKH